MTQNDSPNLAQELRLLERKRQALLRVVRLTASLEKLRQGYEALLHLGQKDQPLPINAVKLFEQLGRKVRNLSDPDIKLRLNGLDKMVLKAQNQVNTALASLIDPKCSDQQLETIFQQIRDFQRLAHTDIALRVLVERRRLDVRPLKLSLSIEELKAKIGEVTHQERNCRVKVSERINAMRIDLQRIIHGGHCSESQKNVLHAMDSALKENIAHINAGKSIDELPTPVEDFELETVANFQVEPAPPLPHPIVDEGTEEETVPQKNVTSKPQQQKPAVPPAADKKPVASGSRPSKSKSPAPEKGGLPGSGLVKRFKIWLSTPWDVSWKDTEKDTKKDDSSLDGHQENSTNNRSNQKTNNRSNQK